MLEIDSSGVVKATGNLQKFAEQAKKSEQTATTLDDVMNQFNMSILASSAGVAGLVKAMQGLVNGIKGVIGNFSHFESMQKNLETFFQSADLGKEKFEELRKLSNQTTFGVDELANSFTQLANVGAPIDEINEQLTMLGNLASGDKTRFAELVSIYSKVLSVGKAGSMQLQQIATKGIPIYDMLKKMGVSGTASAKDITKAFEKMTEQGGQFYNAMNNINDTISGKEGFISDYFKEMTVNFAEASGIVDVYKNILDKVKDVIGAVSDKLLEINQNPIMKALFSGVIFASITALVTLIGTSLTIALKNLIAKLIAVNTQLAIKSALSGPVGWASLALAGVVGLSAGIATLVTEQKKAEQSTKDWGTTISSFQNTAEGYKEVVKDIKEEMINLVSVTDIYNNLKEKDDTTSYMDNLAEKISTISAELEHFSLGMFDAEEVKDIVDILKKQLQEYEKLLETQIAFKTNAELIKKAEEERKKSMQEENDLLQQQLKTVEDIYKKSNQGKLEDLEKQIKEYSRVLTQGGILELKETPKEAQYGGAPAQTYQLTELTKEQKNFFEVALKEAKDAKKKIVDELNLKAILDAEGGWRKIMQNALGLTDQEMRDKGFASGDEYINDYIKKIEDIANNRIVTSNKLGINQASGEKESLSTEISELMSVYNKLLDTGTFGVDENGNLDNTSSAVKEALEKLKIAFTNAGGTVEEFDELLGNTNEDLKQPQTVEGIFKNAKDNLISGTDVGNFATSFAQNADAGMSVEANALISLLEVVVKDIVEVLGGMDEVQQLLNPIKQLVKTLAPILRIVVNCFRLIQLPLTLFIKGLEAVIEFLFGWLDAWFGDFVDSITGVEDENKNLETQLKAINEEYKTLLSAMKEQEEYYLEQKKIINASSYASDVYKVNDMILTPQGNFSTAPDDYIIATKNPNNLGGNNCVKMVVNIENKMGSEAKVTANQINEREMLVVISRQVASDYVSGNNGWKSAFFAKQNSLNGRNLQ